MTRDRIFNIMYSFYFLFLLTDNMTGFEIYTIEYFKSCPNTNELFGRNAYFVFYFF